jgi:hypothetical protein
MLLPGFIGGVGVVRSHMCTKVKVRLWPMAPQLAPEPPVNFCCHPRATFLPSKKEDVTLTAPSTVRLPVSAKHCPLYAPPLIS